MTFLHRVENVFSVVYLETNGVVVVRSVLSFLHMDSIEVLAHHNAADPHTLNFVVVKWFLQFLPEVREDALEGIQ